MTHHIYIVKSKNGELNIISKRVILLAPCLHMMPDLDTVLEDIEKRHKQRYLDLMINNHVKENLVTR